MSQTLSKDEVDALLKGMNDGEVAVTDEGGAPRGVRPYDLVNQDRFGRLRFPALDLVHERFVKRLRPALASFLGNPPALTLGTLEMIKFETFRNRLPPGASLHLFGMTPLRGQCLLAVSPPLAFGLVDRLCGGAGRAPASLEVHEYSPIETQVLERIVARVLAELGEAWAPVQRVDPRLLRTEMNPTQITLTAPSEMVLVLELACDLGAGAAPMIVALPYAALEPLKGKLGEPQVETAPVGGDREWLGAIAAAVRVAEVTVSAELGTCDVPARQVLGLRVGDLLDLGTRGDDPVTLRIEGVQLLTGLAGVSRGQNAVRVLGRGQGEGVNDGR